jgi:hypothetical protein
MRFAPLLSVARQRAASVERQGVGYILIVWRPSLQLCVRPEFSSTHSFVGLRGNS